MTTPDPFGLGLFFLKHQADWLRIVDEKDIGAIREAVRGVNGIDPDGPGTIGGVPIDGTYWIRIDDSGTARIEEIVEALTRASTEYRLQKL